ncbi:MAG: AMP-binding protein [Acidobacteria bacterium]|nr:AMP-binding protein [Acidobacteriota bacterium]
MQVEEEVVQEAVSVPNASLETEMAVPAIARFVRRYPGLREAVIGVLVAGRAVRATSASALGGEGIPTPEAGGEEAALDAALAAAVGDLEACAADDRTESGPAAARFLDAALRRRAASHRFSPSRRSTGSGPRAALFRAIELFGAAHQRLLDAARGQHVPRVPWQLTFSTHVPPTTPGAAIELTGYDLPRTPVADLPWGERCLLSGDQFHTDSRRMPVTRYRSLDSFGAVLAPRSYELVSRARVALEKLHDRCPGALASVASALPAVFDEYVAEPCSPGFAKLGLTDFPSMAVALNNALRAFADRPLFGRRGVDGRFRRLGLSASAGERTGSGVETRVGYGWQTYRDVRRESLRLAAALESLGLEPGQCLGLLASENRPELYVVEFAAVFSRLPTVYLQSTLGDEQLLDIVGQTELAVVFADGPSLERLAAAGVTGCCPSLRLLINIDGRGPAPDPGAGAVELGALLQEAGQLPDGWASASGISPATEVVYDDLPGQAAARAAGIPQDSDEELFTIIYTSGSTGRPKGTPVSRRRWLEAMEYEANVWPYVTVSYQPSALAADRKAVWQVLLNGGRVGFARRGAALFEDVRAIRPTYFEGPPAIWNAVYTEYKSAVASAASMQEVARARARCRAMFGGRLVGMATGGAASDAGMRTAMEEIFGVPMGEGYGTTEAGTLGAGGVLLPNLDFRLVDLAELGFTTADRPYPRGELAVRTPRTIARYHSDEEATRDGFTDDGYFLTGDIVEVRPDRSFNILGRRKELLKVAGSEFVSPAALEKVYRRSQLVADVFVTALEGQRNVAAVVVPSREGVTEAQVIGALCAEAEKEGLRPFEVPGAVVLEPRRGGEMPWTPENGLLTPSFKPRRQALLERYRGAIEAASRQVERWPAALSDPERDVNPAAWTRRIAAVVAEVLDRRPEQIDTSVSFAANGGDSVAALELVLRIGTLLGGESPEVSDSGALASMPLTELARRVWDLKQRERKEAEARSRAEPRLVAPTHARAAGESPARLGPETIGVMATADALTAPMPSPVPPPATGSDLLVTGASGFLGAHLLAELVSGGGEGRVYALVRATDDGAARTRLVRAFASYGLGVGEISIPDDGAENGVVAIAGGLERPLLGVPPAAYKQLACSLGGIYHAAAEVSLAKSYDELRSANVEGTRRLLELATTETLKAFHLVSSLNVALLIAQATQAMPFEESGLPEGLTDELVAGAGGYGVSKWVAEWMVQRVFAHTGGALKTSITRPALISWSSLSGAANASDWMSRLLLSCLATGTVIDESASPVPRWVAETEGSARGLDLVPVDFAARAIVRLGRLAEAGKLPPPGRAEARGRAPTFHVSNVTPGERGLVTWRHLMEVLAAATVLVRPDAVLRPKSLNDWALGVQVAGAPLAPMLAMLGRGLPAYPRTPARRFQAALAATDTEAALTCPEFDLDLVTRFVTSCLRAAG